MPFTPSLKIVSGGQTGVDRAALDWAIAHGWAHGGWCPRGRLAEDGVLDLKYRLSETESDGYRQRTRRNVQDSDATLIVNVGELGEGTLQTVRFAERVGKPLLVLQLDVGATDIGRGPIIDVLEWLNEFEPKVLNIAGPRESKRPGIYGLTLRLLDRLLVVQTEGAAPDRAAACEAGDPAGAAEASVPFRCGTPFLSDIAHDAPEEKGPRSFSR